MYEVSVVEGKGRVLIATRNIRPGEVVILEQKPLLHCSCDPSQVKIPMGIMSVLNKDRRCLFASIKEKIPSSRVSPVPAIFSNYDKDFALKAYVVYQAVLALSIASQQEYLNLYGSFDGLTAEIYYSIANDLKDVCRWSMVDVEQFVKVLLIRDFNAFGDKDFTTFFGAPITLLSHSCKPNCNNTRVGVNMSVRAILSIKIGEELTISYTESNMDLIGFRRAVLRATKGFNCECPRCSALGDDMRQFDCFNKTCSGRHWVCQPLKKDVSYLLPCTECRRTPSPEYETEMFALESKLKQISDELYIMCEYCLQNVNFERNVVRNMLKRLNTMHLPIYHGSTYKAWVSASDLLLFLNDTPSMSHMLTLCVNALKNFTLTMSPHVLIESGFYCVGTKVLYSNNVDADTVQIGIDSMQRAIRMRLLLHGREYRLFVYDERLVELLVKHNTDCEKTVSECMFCRESPENVAIKLSLCGKCKQVAYCSKGCQKAHWKVHKGHCSK